MATEIVGSLFGVTPEMFQQRQAEMADRQALEYAQLSPLQRASFNLARGGYQLAGALGGQDPQLQMISRRQAIARQIDPTNLNSMQMGIQALAQAGDQVGAMQLAQVLRQAENDIALRSQREASATASLAAATRERSQAVPASIQEANRISQITQTLQNPELSPYERMGLEAEMQQLRKTPTSDSIAVSNRIGDLTRSLADPNLPELDRRVLQAQYDQLTRVSGQKPNVPDAIQVAQRISALTRQLQNPELAPMERMALEAEMTQLRKTEREGALPASLQLADAISAAQTRVDELESQPESPERDRALAVAKRRVENLQQQAPQPRGQTQSPALQLAADIENTQALVDGLQNVTASPERDAALRRAVTRLDALQRQLPQQKVEKPESFGADREATARELFNKPFGDLTQDQQASVNRRLARPESFGTDREAVSRELFSKPYADLTTAQQAAVNRRIEQDQARRAPTIQNILPGQRQLADIPAFRRSVQTTIDPQLKSIDAADQALRAIDDSIKTNNFVSFNAARVQLAKALGDSQLSRRDVEQAGGDPSLLGGLYDATSRLFTGTPSIDTQNKIKATLNAIRTVSDRNARAEVDVQRNIALNTPGYDASAVERALNFPQLQQRPLGAGAGAGSLADQAKAELERRRQAGGK